jgi:hypothetical protein
MSALDPPRERDRLMKKGQKFLPENLDAETIVNHSSLEDWLINPGEKYPVKQDNCTQNCMYQADGVVDT